MCLLSAVLLGGCSSASDTEWIRAADRECTAADADLDKLAAPSSLAEVDAYSRAVRERVEELRSEVKPDDDLDSDAPAALDSYLHEQQKIADALTSAAVDGDAAAVQKVLADAASSLSASGARMAKKYGFQSCGIARASG